MSTLISVIGLDRRPDRRQSISRQLDLLKVANVQFAVDLHLAVDWRDWGSTEIKQLRQKAFSWCIPKSSNPWWNRGLKLGEIACSLTHWNIWKHLHEQGVAAAIILEDDSELLPGFIYREEIISSISALDPSWDLLYIGRERLEADFGTIRGFTYPGFSYGTHGYILSGKGISLLLETSLPESVVPIDEFLPAMYMKHPRGDVSARFPQRIKAYGLVEDVVAVRDQPNWVSDTENSPLLVA